MAQIGLERASSPELSPPQPIIFLRLSSPISPQSNKARLISRSLSTPMEEDPKKEELDIRLDVFDQKDNHNHNLRKKSTHFDDDLASKAIHHRRKSKGSGDSEYVLDHWHRISRSLSFSPSDINIPREIAVPDFAITSPQVFAYKDQTNTSKFNFETSHRLLEFIESRIQEGLDKVHKHPALCIAASQQMDGEELSKALDASIKLKGYDNYAPPHLLPSYWQPRVWDSQMSRLSPDDSQSLQKKGLECPMVPPKPLFVHRIEVKAEPTAQPAKLKIKLPVRRQIKDILILQTMNFETESSSEESDDMLF